MKVLELFSGTESFAKVARERGHEVFTVDNNPHFKPDLCIDILDLEPSMIPFKPDIIWASPPCTTFSLMSVRYHWDFPYPRTSKASINLAYVLKTLELIRELKPIYWFIENPRAMLRKFPFMLKPTTVTYCQYGADYMKPTDIFNNCSNWKARAMCKNGMLCHISARRGSREGIQGFKDIRGLKGSIARSIVPRDLCVEILEACQKP